MASIPRPLVRRTLSVPVLLFALVAAVVLTPIALPLGAIVDLITARGRRFRRARTWLLFTIALAIEAAGIVRSTLIAIRHVRDPRGSDATAAYYALELWWVGHHAANLRRMAGLRWLVENPELIDEAGGVLIARHASHADSILPVLLFGNHAGREVRYTLKDSLQWAPAMDLVGNRTHNVFIDRTPGPDSPVLGRMEALAAGAGDRAVTVIFPEGTFYTPERLDRAASRLAQTRPDLEGIARELRFLLPPRPAGTLALLRGAPDADVIFLGHEGMDQFGSLREIARHIPLHDPVRVRLWHVDRADVPTDEKDIVTWLLDQWLEIDEWIAVRTDERHHGRVRADSLAAMEEIAT